MQILKVLLLAAVLLVVAVVSYNVGGQTRLATQQPAQQQRQRAAEQSSIPAQVPEAPRSPYDITSDAGDELKRADEEMNAVYNQILAEYKDDPRFIATMKKAQRAWLVYRDAYLESRYPESDAQVAYGSVFSMCYAYDQAELTKQRTALLRRWLSGWEEGETCAGSTRNLKRSL